MPRKIAPSYSEDSVLVYEDGFLSRSKGKKETNVEKGI